MPTFNQFARQGVVCLHGGKEVAAAVGEALVRARKLVGHVDDAGAFLVLGQERCPALGETQGIMLGDTDYAVGGGVER